jgi:hypothetical protein
MSYVDSNFSFPTTWLFDSMIPHHQNAVNMAKTLLKLGGLSCDDLLNEEQTDCIMVNMMRDTNNSQNAGHIGGAESSVRGRLRGDCHVRDDRY